MAHVQKFTRGAVGGLSSHIERKTKNHSNKDIDTERTNENYDLCEKDGDINVRLQERLNDVHCLNRANVNVMADWVVTLPQELKESPEASQKRFFEETYDFLSERYGKENVLAGVVHNDESTPHIHFAFVPVTYDEKKEREKVSAKEVLNRNELKSFHQDLDKHLKERIPQIYQKGILNDKTIGVENVQMLKEKSKEIERLGESMDRKKHDLNKEIKKVNNLQGKFKNVYDTRKKLDEFENKLGKTILGKRTMSSEDLNELKKFVTGIQKNSLKKVKAVEQLESENMNLFEKLESVIKERDLAVEGKNDLISDNRHLEKRYERLQIKNDRLEDDLTVSDSKLKDMGYNRSKMSEIEYKGHLVMNRLSEGIKPRNKKVAENWLGILQENKNQKLINGERLIQAMEKLKIIIQKMISKIKDIGLGL